MDLPEAADYYEKRKMVSIGPISSIAHSSTLQDILTNTPQNREQRQNWFEIEIEGNRILHIIQV